MRELGLEGARRGRRHRTAIADPGAPRAADLVQLRLTPARPDAVWVADFTRVATWAGTVYVAFVLDAHSRRILGWRAATSMRTDLVLDALEQALWTCTRQGVTDLSGSCATTTPDRNTRRLRSPSASPPPAPRPASERSATPWITPWPRVRSGCSRPELIRRRGPWNNVDDVELATLEWVDPPRPVRKLWDQPQMAGATVDQGADRPSDSSGRRSNRPPSRRPGSDAPPRWALVDQPSRSDEPGRAGDGAAPPPAQQPHGAPGSAPARACPVQLELVLHDPPQLGLAAEPRPPRPPRPPGPASGAGMGQLAVIDAAVVRP